MNAAQRWREPISNPNPASKAGRAALVTDLLQGIKKHYPTGATQLTFGGATITVDDLTNKLQTIVSNRQATVTAQAIAHAKVAAEKAQAPALIVLVRDFVAFVRLTFGTSADALADFGLAPPKPHTPPTAEQKAAAVAKRNATRVARGTKGSKQKKAVKGAVTATLVVTPAPGSSPAGTSPVAAPVTTPITPPAASATAAPATPATRTA